MNAIANPGELYLNLTNSQLACVLRWVAYMLEHDGKRYPDMDENAALRDRLFELLNPTLGLTESNEPYAEILDWLYTFYQMD